MLEEYDIQREKELIDKVEDCEAKLSELKSYLGQLIDLKEGKLKELVLTSYNTKAINLLKEAIQERIKGIEEFLAFDKAQEDEEKLNRCQKCGDEVLPGEKGLCQNCI